MEENSFSQHFVRTWFRQSELAFSSRAPLNWTDLERKALKTKYYFKKKKQTFWSRLFTHSSAEHHFFPSSLSKWTCSTLQSPEIYSICQPLVSPAALSVCVGIQVCIWQASGGM